MRWNGLGGRQCHALAAFGVTVAVTARPTVVTPPAQWHGWGAARGAAGLAMGAVMYRSAARAVGCGWRGAGGPQGLTVCNAFLAPSPSQPLQAPKKAAKKPAAAKPKAAKKPAAKKAAKKPAAKKVRCQSVVFL